MIIKKLNTSGAAGEPLQSATEETMILKNRGALLTDFREEIACLMHENN